MNIVINGGSRGIGREVVLQLAGRPANKIIVAGRNLKALQELSSHHKNVFSLVTDLSEFDTQSSGYYEFISSRFESIDILINTAGLLISKKFLDYTNPDARKIMETNFFGPASAIRVLRPLMREGAHIVNISSMGGFQGSSKYSGLSYYSASKAAIACLTECLAAEFSETGIRVNCLALGSVQTEMLEEAFPGYKAPVSAAVMGKFIAEFAMTGHKIFNGKILPVAVTNP
ncbi:MAG TPA: SDR family oxidoreductase [Bacteroidales bacterium]|jgi:NAD(P)-dependent dehydrogenase (short-subunit alcohol dehydrogenase family)|nr:SDR family oxidoreductase [Bacteroidales bacterium]